MVTRRSDSPDRARQGRGSVREGQGGGYIGESLGDGGGGGSEESGEFSKGRKRRRRRRKRKRKGGGGGVERGNMRT